MRGFKSAEHAQRFLSAFGIISTKLPVPVPSRIETVLGSVRAMETLQGYQGILKIKGRHW
jgi:hypothetical protein